MRLEPKNLPVPVKKLGKKVLSPRQIARAKQFLSKSAMSPRQEVSYPDALKDIKPSSKKSFALNAGVIFDEFSFLAWEPEFNLIEMRPDTWEEQLSDIDFLFVESAWAGNEGAWQYQLTGSNAPSEGLEDLVRGCQERGIPTAFWNKEDPPHFEDFLDTAKLFDVVFTTDSDVIPKYVEKLGHNNVFTLPFAAQPKIHNPIKNGSWDSRKDMAFAGTYFAHKFQSRREQMDLLLGAAEEISSEYGRKFDIFSRHYGKDHKYQFPGVLKQHVIGSLPYAQILSAYKDYKVFLNVNSVTSSPTMCARRVFEILASGTFVATTPSIAIERFFKNDEILITRSKAEAKASLRAALNSPMLCHKSLHRAQRNIWTNHTYQKRAQLVVEKLGFSDQLEDKQELVSIICSSNRPQQVEHFLQQVSHQTYPAAEVLFLAHGFDPSNLNKTFKSHGITNFRIFSMPSDTSLGDCLNELIANASGDYIAKFDDDDFYLENYVSDMVHSAQYSGADFVGKSAIFFYLEGENTLSLRWPHKEFTWTDLVAGATIFARASAIKKLKFRALERGEDTDLLKRAKTCGYSIFSTDRFNYVAVRKKDVGKSHTWKIQDNEVLSYSQVETFGLNLEHVRA
ncbi:glycosyltransferase [uncultured Corynebacterium sp.]|uniref:glycosyltransferase family protein n=1 Tax=uncultured Corynebacterium sp. TaxID=159447 RepID=UPI002599C9BB|nr:glycosyltransferase [uncultured Corynebacterium sp.]